ncbi:UDP-N-acetylmuramyl-tripeptide synthetase [Pseudenhygromyxa sp. WMMC2535]|uniref:UDP-N-acetylmuramyl-tripeptide synthetase n=1 Tax=Pseudenhygromyxa sp. WMMC2535 TaxID=2712867 RepID=UPI001552470B|nr:UDP-N-acetylmuramyl-tripeptide synthetase [Pseudenhygromyxa sp. WMMC2535]
MTNPYPRPPAWAHEIASVGVTGTKGKSSTTHFVAAALAADPRAEGPTARVTTVGAALLGPRNEAGEELEAPPADHAAFLTFLARLHRAGGRRAAIEATSATLGLGFARAWPFRVGVFTNLGHDHLRTHGSVEHYLASKAQLFLALPPGGSAVLNAGDPNAALIAEVLPQGVRALWFAGPGRAEDRAVDLRVRALSHDWSGLRVELEARGLDLPPRLILRSLAAVQAENAAAALLAAVALGVPAACAAGAIATSTPPPGRFEPVPGPAGGPRVIVDYAHTPEALRAVLTSARALCKGRVCLVVGAGGDTDPSKRAPLARAASLADELVLTSDNPRNEDPKAIVDDLCRGLPSAHPRRVELDRERAIHDAIARSQPEDLVLIAGKGHERTQLIAGEVLPFCDREVAGRALAERG